MNSTSISILNAIINDTHDEATLREISGVKEWQFNEQTKKLLQDGRIKKEGNVMTLQENEKTPSGWPYQKRGQCHDITRKRKNSFASCNLTSMEFRESFT